MKTIAKMSIMQLIKRSKFGFLVKSMCARWRLFEMLTTFFSYQQIRKQIYDNAIFKNYNIKP